ncbi:hypothetical protein LguiA_001172 [Lonicera macranthoides]
MDNNNNNDIVPEPSVSPRESENQGDMAEGHIGELVEIGNTILYSAPSDSLSAEDLEMEEEKVHGLAVPAEDSEYETASPKGSSSDSESPKSEISDLEAHNNLKSWRGFLRKLRKGPAKSLHTFHPSIPSFSRRLPRKKSRNEAQSMPAMPPNLDAELYYFEASWVNFSLSDLKHATNNFSKDNLIGEGGYSEVYKGNLPDGQLVAIKRLIRGSPEEMTSDFLSELGILVHVNHPNIAKVIGYGVEGGMHLVLTLSPHGSLASLLNGDKEKLAWGIRYNIALGTASGLSYLHEGCQRRIIHRDIKAANILLTEDFEPQISDFGLAKWLPDQWTHLTVSQFEGTFGYLSPEIFMYGVVDEKTDVYAYGVLLLELITGRPALDESQKSLVMWAKPLIAALNLEELVDPLLDGEYDSEQVTRILLIASQCLHQASTERPYMSQVIRMIKGDEGVFDGRKKFQKRPAFKRIYSEELFEEVEEVVEEEEEEECNTSKPKSPCINDLNQQNQIALEL